VKNLEDLLSLSPLIIINNILYGVLAIIAFYLTFYVAYFMYIVLYGIGYCIHVPYCRNPAFGCNTTINVNIPDEDVRVIYII